MDFERKFVVPAPPTAVTERTKEAWAALGYSIRSGDPLTAARGSWLGSLTSFSPTKWKADATVHARPRSQSETEVRLRLHVNTTGQMVTHRDRQSWTYEVASIEQAIARGTPIGDTVARDERTFRTLGWRGVLVFFATFAGVGIVAGGIAFLIDPSFTRAGALLGVAAGMAMARRTWGL